MPWSALAVVPAKGEPPSLKALTQSRLGAFTKQGTLIGIIEAYTDQYGSNGYYLLLVAGKNYVGVPLVNGRDNLNSYTNIEPYSPNFWVSPNYSVYYFESYDCTGIPIIDGQSDGAVRLGVFPAKGYTDTIGQTRIAFSTSVITQVYTANSMVWPGQGCTTTTQQIVGYNYSGSIPLPSQFVGKRIP